MHQKIKLESRRNDVFRVWKTDKTVICKQFRDEDRCQNEERFLRLLKGHGLEVPTVFECSDNRLILEDLGDTTLLDWYEAAEQANDTNYQEVLFKLAQWMKRFYSITKAQTGASFILSDVNFKNFILKEAVLYGIDFEETTTGDVLSDCVQLGAFALMYDPIATPWKQDFVKALFSTLESVLGIDKKLLYAEYEQAVKKMTLRRKNQK